MHYEYCEIENSNELCDLCQIISRQCNGNVFTIIFMIIYNLKVNLITLELVLSYYNNLTTDRPMDFLFSCLSVEKSTVSI